MTSSPFESSEPKLYFNREPGESRYFTEDLGNGVGLDMTLIPTGTFLMGSPEEEPERHESEGPQHEVRIQQFFMGTYPVTQAQWRGVASFEQVDRPLKPEPSKFKGDRRPVEQVSWEEAIEFCNRLSKHTNRAYRLPSEAEWEYACRAKTDTPFHFGATINTKYANYRGVDSSLPEGKGTYGPGSTGKYRKITMPVDHFEVSNGFGLFDMHGNVWEWCQDSWHTSYVGNPPNNGSVWAEKGDLRFRILRGGSWNDYPNLCRSAFRLKCYPYLRTFNIGFRVVLSTPRFSNAYDTFAKNWLRVPVMS